MKKHSLMMQYPISVSDFMVIFLCFHGSKREKLRSAQYHGCLDRSEKPGTKTE